MHGTTGSNGAIAIGTNLTLNVIPGGNWGDGTYHLVHYTGALTDSSAGLSGWSVTGTGLGSNTYTFSTTNTTNYLDLVVTSVVPEPASLGLLVLGTAGLLLRRRR